MPIYTKTGDKGMTSLFGGKRVSKDDIRVGAYGCIDELSAHLGVIIAKLANKEDKKILLSIQKDLWQIMAFLAGAKVNIESLEGQVKTFEQNIDKVTSKLPKLNRFILPGGTETSAFFHLARTSARKTERMIVSLYKKIKKSQDKDQVLQYFNRLSDLLFTFARKYSRGKENVT